MGRRTIWPVTPIRWIHCRRGGAPSVQHVLARRLDDAYPERERCFVPLLCSAELVVGPHNRGPRTLRPLVTIRRRADLPTCPTCESRLANIAAIVDPTAADHP